ncbi:MAG: hypothetical protein ACKO01_05260 [Erythrobacter sp.]
MFSRTSSSSVLLVTVALVGGCDAQADLSPSPDAVASASPAGPAITCAVAGSTTLGPGCLIERLAGGSEIVLYHPDGGFRRIVRDPATGTLRARDGAELLVVEERGADAIRFAVGADRYRVPLALLEPPK